MEAKLTNLSIDQLHNMFILANKNDLVIKDRNDKEHQIVFWQCKDKISNLTILNDRVINNVENFWQSKDIPMNVTFLCSPVSDFYIGGQRKGDNVINYVPQEDDYLAQEFIMTHEYIHYWFGGVIKSDQNIPLFHEGFTDYYTYKILGMNDPKIFIGKLNDNIYKYISSDFKEATNEELGQLFWEWCPINKMSYIRGFLIALVLDDKYDLDSFFRKKIQFCKSNKCKFSTEFFKDLGDQKEISNIIDHFNLNMIPDSLKKLNLKLGSKEGIKIDYGFNMLEYFKNNVMGGVKENSVAYKSGLRNGMKIKHSSFDEKTVKFTIFSPKKETIEYKTNEEKISVPYFVPLNKS